MANYLNTIQELNTTFNLVLSSNLLQAAPNAQYPSNGSAATQYEKDAFYMLTNALRVLRIIIDQVTQDILVVVADPNLYSSEQTTFLIIMIAGILISSLSVILIVQHIIQSEAAKVEIIGVLTLLGGEEVTRVYDVCDRYID